jgi:hypothetical protein
MFIDIKFPITHELTIWNYIKSDFEKCKTIVELSEFTIKCQQEAENSKNPVRKDAYDRTFKTLYSILSGKSYESKITF